MDFSNFDAAPQAESDRSFVPYESIVQPQVILPAQFSGGRRQAAPSEPLRRLMAAILEDAVRCFQKNINARHLSQRREFYEAAQWFFGSEAAGPFAFNNVCHILDLDPRHIRHTLRDWSASRIARREGSFGAVVAGGSGRKRASKDLGRREPAKQASAG